MTTSAGSPSEANTTRSRWNVGWTKTYIGAHDVFYRGFREGKGIWGTWEITVHARGGFHIWPKRMGEARQLRNPAKRPLRLARLRAKSSCVALPRQRSNGLFHAIAPHPTGWKDKLKAAVPFGLGQNKPKHFRDMP